MKIKLIESNLGKEVFHKNYGYGFIFDEKDDNVYVEFESGKKRIFPIEKSIINGWLISSDLDSPLEIPNKSKTNKIVTKNDNTTDNDFTYMNDACDNPKSPYYLSEKERKLGSEKLPSYKYGDVELHIFRISKRYKIPKKYLRVICREENITNAFSLCNYIEKYNL